MLDTTSDSPAPARKRRRFSPSEAAKRRAHVAQAYINLGVSQLALGSGGILARFIMAGMGLYAAGAMRLGSVGLLLVARMAWLRRPLLNRRDELLLVASGLLLAQQFTTWMLSISYLTIGTATLLYCTAPLWNGLYEVFFLKRHLPVRFWMALLTAGAGVSLMVYEPSGGVSTISAGQRTLGIVLALSSGVGVAAHLVVMRKLAKRGSTAAGYGMLDLLARSYTYAALALLVVALIDGTPLPPFSNWQPWAAILAMAVFSQGFGSTLQNSALKHVRASVVGFSTLLEPLIASALGAVVFHETMTILNGVGGVVVLLALAWALKITQQQADAEHAVDGPLAEGTNTNPK